MDGVSTQRYKAAKVAGCLNGKTLGDRCKNEDNKKMRNIQDISEYKKIRRKYWKKHIERM